MRLSIDGSSSLETDALWQLRSWRQKVLPVLPVNRGGVEFAEDNVLEESSNMKMVSIRALQIILCRIGKESGDENYTQF